MSFKNMFDHPSKLQFVNFDQKILQDSASQSKKQGLRLQR